MTEAIKLFFKEATQELLYNIVHQKRDDFDKIGYRELSEEFEEKVGFRPMDFFGLRNFTRKGWFEFLKSSPGLCLDRKKISIDNEYSTVYQEYNSSYLLTTSRDVKSVAEYRQILLIQACKLITKDGLIDVNTRQDDYGNTPLHLVAAMPGIADDGPTLVRYLLTAGADPLLENNEGLNILHIIAGRMRAEEDEDDKLYFGTERIDARCWELDHRKGLLNVLFEKLSPAQLATLTSKPHGDDGNTVMHEWVLSTSSINFLKTTTVHQLQSNSIAKEIEIASKLLSVAVGGNLRIPNKFGLVPLHFACNSAVFQFLLQNGAVCRSRSDRDETSFLFILKFLVGLVFVGNTSAAKEIKDFLSKQISLEWSAEKAVLVLKHLIKSVDESEELRKTVWIPDIDDSSPLEIVLVCIRICSYHLEPGPLRWISFDTGLENSHLGNLRSKLVELLNRILRTGNPGHLRRQNKKGQGPLHVLLDMGSSNTNTINVDTAILQSLQVLIQNGADMNAVDARGQTALDVTYKHINQMPSLYKQCAAILLKNGGKSGSEIPSEVRAAVNEQFLASSTLPVVNARRKLRACPQRHSNTAQQLTEARSNVTVVQKYRYFSQTPIGSGAFSSIYVAIKDEHVDKQSGTVDCRAIALKRLEKAKINPQEINREVQALLSISTSCENILNYYDSFEDEFFHYLCLDLMDGDLRQFIEDGSAKSTMQKSAATPVQAAQEIINGLSYLHEKNFIHRDLKPGNILYTIHPSLHFKIGDFGLAKNVSSLSTMTSTRGGGVAMAPGTRCWMAPELVSLQSRDHTKESDVFALGLVLHYLLSLGKHPFVGATEEPAYVTEKNIVDTKISIDGSLSSEADNFIQVILAKTPSRRPPAKYLKQHPFLWSEKKKMEFLKVVGDQPEAVNPSNYPNSVLEQCLQKTSVGRQLAYWPWDQRLPGLFTEMTRAWKLKKYRTDYVIDLVRFLRNAYAHKEERLPSTKLELDNNIFLTKFPALVLDVFMAVQQAGYDDNRSSIRQAISMS